MDGGTPRSTNTSQYQASVGSLIIKEVGFCFVFVKQYTNVYLQHKRLAERSLINLTSICLVSEKFVQRCMYDVSIGSITESSNYTSVTVQILFSANVSIILKC